MNNDTEDGESKPRPPQKFHQAPLALLQHGETYQDKLHAIIAVSTVNAGAQRLQSFDNRQLAIRFIENSVDTGRGYNPKKPGHVEWALGRGVVGSSFPSVEYNWDCYSSARTLLNLRSPLVRIPQDIADEAECGQFEERDFCVLCAVWALIGDRQYAIVRRDRVRAGALGYSSQKALFGPDGKLHEEGIRTIGTRTDHKQPLSENQVRHTLNKLHTRKFVSRIHPWKCCRTTYYSRGLSHDALADQIVNRIARKVSAGSQQDLGQQRFREKAAALLKRWVSGGESFDQKATGEAPHGNRVATAGPTGGPTASPTAGPTGSILAPCIDAPFISSLSDKCTDIPPDGGFSSEAFSKEKAVEFARMWGSGDRDVMDQAERWCATFDASKFDDWRAPLREFLHSNRKR